MSKRNHKFVALMSIRNEAPWIEHSIHMVAPFVDGIVIGRGLKSWRNDFVTDDGTTELLKPYIQDGPVVYFEMEAPESDEWQRNQVLNKIREVHPDCDYVFIVDPDEFYHTKDLDELFLYCDERDPSDLGTVRVYAKQFMKNMITCVGEEHFGPVMISLRDQTHFSYIRNVDQDWQETFDIFLYHMTAVRSNHAMEEKILGWSHSHEVVPRWLEEVWYGNKQTELHPVSPSLWPQRSTIGWEELPTILRIHPYYGKEEIE